MIRRAAALGALALALTGCGGTKAMPGAATSAPPAVAVLAAFYPYYYVAQQVGGPQVQVGLLTHPGVEPHDLELSPRQVAEVGESQLVIYQQGFQPAVDEAVATQKPQAALEVNAALGRTPVAEVHEDDHGAPGDLAADPHVWSDPDKLATVATATAEALGRIDPAGSAGYQQRAAELRTKLAALNTEFSAGLATCVRRKVVVNHAAFGHLTSKYGLEQIAVNGLSPDAAPSPQYLSDLASTIRQDGATTVFTESLASPRLAETLAREAGVATAVLDPLEGLADGDSRDFLEVMRANLAALRTGLDCTARTSPRNSPAPTP